MSAGRLKTVSYDARMVWNPRLEELLELVFEGRISHTAMAEKIGVSKQTVFRWIAHPDFRAALAAKRADLETALLERGTAYVSKESRIIALAAMAESAREEYEKKPLLEEKRQIGRDDDGNPLYQINEAFNRDAHDSFRQALTDIAKELGHRVTRADISGNIDINERVLFVLPQREEIAAPREILVLPERSDDHQSS